MDNQSGQSNENPFNDKNPLMVEKQTSPQQPNRTIIYILGAIIVLLLGAGGLLLFDNQSQSEEISKKDTTISELDTEIKDLEKDIAEKENELTSTTNEKEELVSQLKALQEKITNYKFLVNRMMTESNRSKEEKDKLQGKYDQLVYYDTKNKTKIQELQTQIEQLQTENQGLKSTIGAKDEQIGHMSDEIKTKDNEIKSAAYLTAAGFVFTASYGGKDKELDDNDKRRASRTKSIRVCFTVAKNNVAKKGSRSIFLVVKTPNGAVMNDKSSISGYFKPNGREGIYSAKTNTNFDGSATQVCIDYKKSESQPFEKGRSIIEIYSQEDGGEDAYLMGTSSFDLK